MRKAVETAAQVCPVEVAVAVLGGTWKLTIVKHLLEGTLRFGELGRLLPLAGARTLTRQLRELEEDGVVDRKVFAQVPPKVEYSLTALGRSLENIVADLDRWGTNYALAEAQLGERAQQKSG
jgi:DNA-binding HxlR family transcriptional regulator